MSGHQAILGGDWNMSPEVLLKSGFPEKLEGSLIKPAGSGTCRSLGGLNFLDYFVCTGGIAKGIQSTSIVQVAQLTPHKPVHLQLFPRLAQLCALTFRKPPPIPRERPIGVGRSPPDWGVVQDAAEGCLGTALSGQISEAQEMLDWVYGRWADLAERELCDLAQITLPYYGARSKSPQLHWVPIIKDKAPPFRHPKLFAGKWVSHRFQDLIIEYRDGALEASKTRESLLKPPSFVLIVGCVDWDQYLSTIQSLVRAVPDGKITSGERQQWGKSEWLEAAQDALVLVQQYVTKLQGEARHDGEMGWKNWLLTKIKEGGKNAHLASKEAPGWKATTTLSAGGLVLSDPLSLLKSEASGWAELWHAGSEATDSLFEGVCQPLPMVSIDQIRSTAAAFKATTAQAVDGFHMRHYSWLSDSALAVVSLLFAIFESLSSLPRQLQIIQDVSWGIKEGSRQLEQALVHECGCSISLSKAGQGNLVCSDGAVARELQMFLGDRTGPLADSIVDLGIDFTAGRSRRKAYIRRALRESKFKIRMANLKAKTRKVRIMKKQITSHAKKIWVSGPLPGVLYGSEVHGISDGELHRIRQQAGSVMGPSCKGRSLTSLLILEDEPTWLAAVAPLVRYSKELWCAHSGAYRWCFSFTELREAWRIFCAKPPPATWRDVTGPFSAMYMCLKRIQWKMTDWVSLENDFGEKLVLTEV
ncbi:unnamed protein product, partial [Prorocentrum cordatum]